MPESSAQHREHHTSILFAGDQYPLSEKPQGRNKCCSYLNNHKVYKEHTTSQDVCYHLFVNRQSLYTQHVMRPDDHERHEL